MTRVLFILHVLCYKLKLLLIGEMQNVAVRIWISDCIGLHHDVGLWFPNGALGQNNSVTADKDFKKFSKKRHTCS